MSNNVNNNKKLNFYLILFTACFVGNSLVSF